jgi:hypothetical protein
MVNDKRSADSDFKNNLALKSCLNVVLTVGVFAAINCESHNEKFQIPSGQCWFIKYVVFF